MNASMFELDTVREQLRTWEDTILKAQGECALCNSTVDRLLEQQEQQQGELSQLAGRSTQIDADIASARSRITELEGAATALKSEAEGKAQGQTDLQARWSQIAQETTALSAQLAGLEAERDSTAGNLRQLEGLLTDISGDRDQSRAAVEEYEEKIQLFSQEIGEKEEELHLLRGQSQSQTEEIQRLNEQKLALEGQRTHADKESREKNSELLNMEREVSVLEQKKAATAMEEKTLLDKLWESYELSHEAARAQRVELESIAKAARRIGELKKSISSLGAINIGAIEEFERVNERYTYLTEQRDDVERAKNELQSIINKVTAEMRNIFARQFQTINEAFGTTFTELFGGGKATLELENPDDILNCGIEIKAQPPGKALKSIMLLSGGEKAFVAIALYFAILKVRPTPFVVMDEIEAALDDINVTRFARYMRGMSDSTQFIIITHRRGTMEEADVLYGVTMQEQGISRMLTINLNDVAKELKL